ncbi:MAG: high-affinity branched-chain amino acid ABC transporter ATP-binding protein LivG [Cardiobacteriaceae bacterium]|nr:high-affinity branched-chain amino acid ABC transporter ATP-binding protein LivG [Cardiobacteriaceae bacterium]
MMTILLNIKGLKMRFGGLLAVNDVNFAVKRNEIAAIIGPNGAGKTTVFNCISGFYKPTAGRITLEERDITGLSSDKICRAGLTRTFQNIRLFSKMTVLENLLVARHNQLNRGYFAGIFRSKSFKESEKNAIVRALEILEFFGLTQHCDQAAENLAYGKQRLLEIARCLMTNPKIIILDEPAAGLNPQETAELGEFIRNIRAKLSTAVVLIEHDMNLVMNIAENIMVMEYGCPIAYGNPAEIRANERVIKAYLGEE